MHLEGPGLDLMVEWSAGAGTARDLATRGGHAAVVLIGDAVSVNDELEAAQRLGDPSPVSRSTAGESSLLVIASRSKSS